MLSCGRVIGRLPNLAGRVYPNQFYRPLNYAGIVSTTSLWYSDNASIKKTYKAPGTTIKPEECVPESSRKSNESQKQGTQDDCNGGNSGKRSLPYWKILAALVIAGVTTYTVYSTNLFKVKESKPEKDVSEDKKESVKKFKRPKETVKVPQTSSAIPKEVPYVLIGGGTAAFSAFRSIKSRDAKAKVLVITEEDLPYMRPPLSKELWYNKNRKTTAHLRFKQWNGSERSLFYEPSEFYADVSKLIESEKGGVALATGWKVTKIDVMNKTVILDDGYEIKYDKCLIATGSSPKTLPVFESASDAVKEKVITFRTKDDFLELEDNVHDPNCKNIVIIGGGFLGSELACAIARNYKDKKVYQVYKEKHILAQVIPEYLSEWATGKSILEGVHCIPNSEVTDFTYKNGQLSLTLTDNQVVEADKVVVAVGAEPNTQLATASRLETDPEVGGFIVNAELEARSNLWVAGDAACFYDVALGRRRVEHHDHAVISGRLAGDNMTGARKPYLHQSMFWSDLGPAVGFEAIGIVDSTLPTVAVFAKTSEADKQRAAAMKLLNEVSASVDEEEKADTQAETAEKQEVELQVISKEECKPATAEGGTTESVETSQEEEPPQIYEDFERGVVFYLRDDTVVGIVLWNVFNRMSIARQVIARGTKYDELNEAAKLFTIHED